MPKDFDWMYTPAGEKLLQKNPYYNTHSKVYIIENSDHHMYFDNPQEFANKILLDLNNVKDLDPLIQLNSSQ